MIQRLIYWNVCRLKNSGDALDQRVVTLYTVWGSRSRHSLLNWSPVCRPWCGFISKCVNDIQVILCCFLARWTSTCCCVQCPLSAGCSQWPSVGVCKLMRIRPKTKSEADRMHGSRKLLSQWQFYKNKNTQNVNDMFCCVRKHWWHKSTVSKVGQSWSRK